MERNTFDVFKVGAKVLIMGDTPGQVTAVMIESVVSYRVAYWNGGKLECDWMVESLVKLKNPDDKTEKLPIGFRSK